MSDFVKCDKCGQYGWEGKHRCTLFHVYYPEYYGEEWEPKYGTSMENVIENIAEQINQDDPIFEDHIFESPVSVRSSNGAVQTFNCIAQISIDYSTRDLPLDNDLPEFKE